MYQLDIRIPNRALFHRLKNPPKFRIRFHNETTVVDCFFTPVDVIYNQSLGSKYFTLQLSRYYFLALQTNILVSIIIHPI